MAFLNLDLNYFDHPKTKRLNAILGQDADLRPIKLWVHCGRFHAKDGCLSGYSDRELEGLTGWKCDLLQSDGVLVAAMAQVGFLVECAHGKKGWDVKDWAEINGHIDALKVRAKVAAEARWGKYRNAQAMPKHTSSNAPSIHPSKPSIHKEVVIPETLKSSEPKIREWLDYKREKGQTYKTKGLEALWRCLEAIPEAQRGAAIDHSMASNYAGIFPPKENNNGTRKSGAAAHKPGKYSHLG